jgi:hypothetical protein
MFEYIAETTRRVTTLASFSKPIVAFGVGVPRIAPALCPSDTPGIEEDDGTNEDFKVNLRSSAAPKTAISAIVELRNESTSRGIPRIC